MLGIAFLLIAGAVPAESKTITIKATFRYVAPNGVIKPVRFALAELRDSDTLSDDVIAHSYTSYDGSVTFTYDSGLDDGWGGGRVDPYVRCYPKFYMPSYDMSSVSGQTEWTYLARVGRGTGFAYIEPSYATLDTATWSNNDSDRTAEVKAEGEAGATFFILDCAVEANMPTSSENYRAPMALGDLWCFPGAAFDTGMPKTAYMPDTEIILIDVTGSETPLEFDAVVHEYGHREMCRYYGSSFGNYDCTRSSHSFEEALKNKWYLPSDAEWSALAEGWADFCPVITKRQPLYRGSYNVESPSAEKLVDASASCEGTVCRIFWDICDTYQDKTAKDKLVVDRTPIAGFTLDDDPFGFAGRVPYSTLPGLEALKGIIRKNNPKSLWGVRDAWRTKFASNKSALRALDATFYLNGVRDDITENPPDCALSLSGPTTQIDFKGEARQAYVGDVTLSATVNDLDTDDRPFLHVYFYWAYMSEYERTKGQISETRREWNAIGADINGADGFSVRWPKGVDRPLAGKEVCVIAVSSDFMRESAWTTKLDPQNRTGGQVWNVIFAEGPSGGSEGGATGSGTQKPSGPLSEVGYYSLGGFDKGMRVFGDKLYVAAWGEGLKVLDITTPEAPRLTSIFRPEDVGRSSTCHDVDIYAPPADGLGRRRIYAVLAYSDAGLRIVDVTDPFKPVLAGGLGGFNRDRVAVTGNYAVLYESDVTVVDISNPAKPVLAATWRLPGQGGAKTFDAWGAALRRDTLYFGSMNHGLSVVSLRDILTYKGPKPREKREVAERLLLGSYVNEYHVHGVEVMDHAETGRRFALCLDVADPVALRKAGKSAKNANRLSVLDVTKLSDIREVASLELTGSLFDVTVSGTTAFVGRSGGVTMFDFTDPDAPRKVCDFKGTATYSGGLIEVYKDYLFVLVANDHLGILKINK